MSKDVKIEIIYYKTDTDVSLEFGLHGNYPVRLLSSSSDNLQSFFNLFKRAVSRSEIIITVGGYECDESFPLFIAKAIGKNTVVPEYGKLGVIAENKYALPEGAVPLAPSNKRYGGFLIESGPQTIISLTENKQIRLSLLNEVIVKYIEEHHNFFANGYNVVQQNDNNEDTLSVLPEIEKKETEDAFSVPEAFEDISSLSATEEVRTENTEANVEEATTEVIEEDSLDNEVEVKPQIVTETELLTPETDLSTEEPTSGLPDIDENEIEVISNKYTNPENQILEEISPDDFSFDKEKTKNKEDNRNTAVKTVPHRRFLRLICIILSLLIILSMAVAVFLRNRTKADETVTKDYYAELADTYSSYGDDLAGAFEALKEHNSNINAWITVNGTEINFPILSVEENNSFYLNHLPNGTENLIGSVYTSANVGDEVLKHNVILYGSAEGDVGVFSELIDLLENEDITEIQSITFANSHSKTEWRIVSMFTEAEAEELMFEVNSFDTDAKYTAFLKQILRHNRTNQKAVLKDDTAPMLMLIAQKGSKKYIICASPYANVSAYTEKSNSGGGTVSNNPGILIDIENAIIDFIGKTEDNTGEFEQKPIDPDNVIVLPPVIPPASGGTTSSESTVTSSGNNSSNTSSNTTSNTTSSKDENVSSDVSSEQNSSEASSDTSSESSNEASSESSSESSSSEPSGETSSDSSSNTSSDASSESSSEASSESSSEASSEDTSSDESNVSSSETSSSDSSSDVSSESSSTTSSDTSSGGSGGTENQPVDPLYTWDVTLYVKQSNGTIVYGPATEIVARVIEAEMGSSFPLEALKAQAVATYAWLLNNGALSSKTAPSGVPMKQKALSLCIQAVSEVKGTLITYNGTIAQTYYYAYSAGFSANVQDIWTTKIPYLQSVECPVDTELPYFITTKTYTADEVKELILKKCDIDVSEMDKNLWIVPVEYDQNNTYCTVVEIGGVKYKGTYLRNKLFGTSKIRSSAYTVAYDSETDTFTISCKGWGHGVGMSQEGAKAYANQGWTYDQILAHFYTGTTLLKY